MLPTWVVIAATDSVFKFFWHRQLLLEILPSVWNILLICPQLITEEHMPINCKISSLYIPSTIELKGILFTKKANVFEGNSMGK